MRTIYVIRHAQISFPQGVRRCISKTDLPLDQTGIYQAKRLREWAQAVTPEAIYASPLRRCVQTADIMAGGRITVRVCTELKEMSVGEWENMTFDEIREKYPVEYAARGENPAATPTPNGESFIEAGTRLINCIDKLMAYTQGNIAIVAHGGINRGALSMLMGLAPGRIMEIRQPYGSISTLNFDANGKHTVVSVGEKPDRFPKLIERKNLIEKYRMTADTEKHCRIVADTAELLVKQITGLPVDNEVLRAACELHDISKGNGLLHAETGAKLLQREGYPAVAEIIATHHDLPSNPSVESEILYLADKLVLGSRRVTLEERFAASKEKCLTPDSLAAWQRRLTVARGVVKRYKLDIQLLFPPKK